jgi:membrane fusion protein (multidrug efflux system)
MRPGQKAIVSVDAYGGRTYQGHVDSIAAATGAKFSMLPPENATGNFVKVVQRIPVKIVIEKGQGAEGALRPGMSVEPTVYTK